MIKKNRMMFGLILIYVVWFSVENWAEKVTVLSQLNNPKNLIVDQDEFIVADYPFIYIYSLKDYTLKKRFGGEGQGPGEFHLDLVDQNEKARGLLSSVLPGRIVVNSQGRLSYFDRQGKFLSSVRKNPFGGGRWFIPLGNDLFGFSVLRGDNNKLTALISLYDNNLKTLKTVTQCPFWFSNSHDEFDFFKRAADSFMCRVYNDQLFVVIGGDDKFEIHVFNREGKKRYTVHRDYEKIKVSKAFIDEVHRYFRLKFKRGLEFNLKNTQFAEYFPPIRQFEVDDGKIYVITYKKVGNQTEVLVLDLQGNLVKKVMLPVYESNPEYLSPLSFHNGKIYQLVENEENEEWELHITVVQ